MIANQTELEKTLIRALITVFAGRSDPPEKADIEEKAKELALVLSYDGDLRSVVEGAMIAIDTRMGAGVSLVNLEANHDEDWVYKRDGVEWTYSEAYEDSSQRGEYLPCWLHRYNWHRPHASLKYQTPIQSLNIPLNNVVGLHT